MIYVILVLAVVGVLFLIFKGKIREFITKKVKEKKQIKEDEEDFIFLPVGMSRQFTINFTIEEVGGGKAKIIIQKKAE